MVSRIIYSDYPSLWAKGANAVGRYFRYDRETCTNCGKRIGINDPPKYFELDRVLCGDCHVRR